MTDTASEKPTDPGAPAKETLPSGKVVQIRSHRTLLGADIAATLAAQPGGTWMTNIVAMRNHLIAALASEIEPGRRSKTPLDGTLEAVLAQEPDDYRALYGLVEDAVSLTLGLSVIPDLDEHEDPKAPTAATSGSKPASAGASRP